MDQNIETPMPSNEPEIPAAQEVIDVQATQVGEPVSMPVDSAPASGTTYASASVKSNNGWIIALVVLVVLCCCCLILFVPMVLLWNVFTGVFVWIYQMVIDILNGIFGGSIRFY